MNSRIAPGRLDRAEESIVDMVRAGRRMARLSTRRAGLCIAAVVGVFLAELHFGFGGPRTVLVVDDVALLVAALAAAVPCWLAARRRQGLDRRAWMFLTAALVAWATAEAIWGSYEVILGREVPFPSMADGAYLAAPVLAGVALALFAAADTDLRVGVRLLLDGAILGGSLFLVSWALVLRPLFEAGLGDPLAAAVALAYPVSDIALAVMVVLLLARPGASDRVPIALVGSGLLAMALADSAYAYFVNAEAYDTGALIDAGWLAGYLLLGLAGLAALRSGRTESTLVGPRVARLAVVLPSLPVAVALSFVAADYVRYGELRPVLFWGGITIVVLVLVRQLVVLFENLSLTRELEAKVQQRTRELIEREARLRGALGRLQEADRLKDEFLSLVSHEVRTPLTPILGFATLLADRGEAIDAETRAEASQRLLRNARELHAMLERLLDFSQLGHRPTGIELQPILLGAAVRQIVDGSPAAHGTQQVEFDVPDDLTVLVDPKALGHVVDNLVANAVKYAPAASVIRIAARPQGDDVVVTVADDGPGIPSEYHERIFERFVQGPDQPAGFHGTGVGLAIVRDYVALMGGRVWVDSAPERGSAFSFTVRHVPDIAFQRPARRAGARPAPVPEAAGVR